MRHRIAGRRLGRDSEHRLAMRRNMTASLFEHETISTTIQKAKEVKPFAEKLITLAKKGTLAARRRAISLLGNRDIITDQEGQPARTSSVIRKLFSEIGPRYLDRPGGYTRIIRLAQRRLGDNGQVCLLQLVTEQEKEDKHPKKKSKSAKKTKTKKAARKIGDKTPEQPQKTESQETAEPTKPEAAAEQTGETSEQEKTA